MVTRLAIGGFFFRPLTPFERTLPENNVALKWTTWPADSYP
jgi:hypothetical protein